ncbi:MAG: hypothetical protein E7447_07740 [Ruminococcaceae bacterium]|nr:hypothetical protein [Oscillospiraceae bacterium]
MANNVNGSDIRKLKLLFTVVERPKAEFYQDVLSQYEVNCQLVMPGLGTAKSELIDMLGLNIHKAVLLSVVREDRMNEIMKVLETKFTTIKNGKGFAFAVPMSSVIGVNTYQFLSNNRYMRGDNHDNQ